MTQETKDKDFMKKEPQEAATSSTQKSLSVILDEIEARASKATPGPWVVTHDAALECGPHARSGLAMIASLKDDSKFPWPPARLCEWPTARFIAASRSDVPKLVKALRYAVHSMREYSQQHDFDTDSEIADITAILGNRDDVRKG